MKYSIITATYNHEKTIGKLLESLSYQTERDFELIVCDDGSSDNTVGIVESTETNFPKKVVKQKHKGMRLARNINNGLRIAQGDYCVFIMGDSFPETNYLETLNELVGENNIICGCRVDINNNRAVGYDWRLAKGRVPEFPTLLPDDPFNAITGNGLTVPRQAFIEHGGWNEDIEGYGGDDNELVARLYYNGYLVFSVPNLILYHNYHISTPDKKENGRIVADIIKKYAGR